MATKNNNAKNQSKNINQNSEKVKKKFSDNSGIESKINERNNLGCLRKFRRYININCEKKIKIDNMKKDIQILTGKIPIIFILLLNIIHQILLRDYYYERYISKMSEITLKVNGTGKQKILYSSYLYQAYDPDNLIYFYNCPSKIYINNEEIKKLTSCTTIDIPNFDSLIKLVWDKPLNSTRWLFYYCVNIIEVNLTNFNTSLVTDMAGMFRDCHSLISVELSNLVTKNNEYLNGVFYNCYSLKSIDLSSFDSSKVWSLYAMFYNCNSLISIDLSNFDTSSVKYMNELFFNCSNLEYINIKNFSEKKNLKSTDMFYGIAKNAVICLAPNKSPKIYNIVRNISCITISCDNNWRSIQKKINVDIKECFDNCNLTNNLYEYQGKCYNKCPMSTFQYNYMCYTCDTNCKTCSFISTNCTSCYYSKYLKNHKCVDYCENGYYIDENDSSNKICECEMNKCKKCSKESKSKNLCITCNDGYYQIIDNIIKNGKFIDCYNYSIPGYYFDMEYKYYKKCYISCATCDQAGNNTNHNCSSCKNDYPFEFNIFPNINCYNNCQYYSYYNPYINKSYCTFNYSCPKNFSKLIKEKNICIDDCSKDDTYKYEFQQRCYQECPLNISEPPYKNDFFCKVKCPMEFPFEIISKQICVNNCTNIERRDGLCIINFESEENEIEKEVEEKAVENIREQISSNFYKLGIQEGKKFAMNYKYSTIILNSFENEKNNNFSNATKIDFGECEYKIKDEYNISRNNSLYIFKIEVKQKNIQIPVIEYEVYYPLFNDSLIQLNLTVCEDSNIVISIPFNLTEDIDKININSGFYNDICYTYTTKGGTDISLLDRKKEYFEKNLIACEEDCTFLDYDYILERVICSCKIKTNSTMKIAGIEMDKDRLFNSFTNIKNIANYKVLKCSRLIFVLEAYKHNYGNLILLSMILLFFVCLIIFYCKDYFLLKSILNNIIFLKINSSLVQKIITKKKKEENNQKENLSKKDNKITVSNRKKKSSKNLKDKQKQKKQDTNPLYIEIKKDAKSNSTIKNRKKSKNVIVGVNHKNKETNNTQSKNSIVQLNKNVIIDIKDIEGNSIKLNEEKIYEIYLQIHNYTAYELDFFIYQEAIKKDKRTLCMYYISLIRTKHLLFFSFLKYYDYNSRTIKIFLFFFNFSTYFFVNALFFDDETMHKILEDNGSFNFIYNLPHIIYSIIICGIINALVKTLALSNNQFIQLKQNLDEENNIHEKAKKILFILKIKFLFFFLISLILLLFFWFYLSCFCAVYKNTQLHLIKDTVISFSTSMIYPFGIYLFPAIFRITALKNKNKKYMFNLSKLLQSL